MFVTSTGSEQEEVTVAMATRVLLGVRPQDGERGGF